MHWTACKCVLQYLKGTIHLVLFIHPSSIHDLYEISDVDWAFNVDDRCSTEGYCIYLSNNLVS